MEMELQQVRQATAIPSLINSRDGLIVDAEVLEETPLLPDKQTKCFIEANTKEVNLWHLKNDCITPVFSRDNEVTISHSNFIETVWDAVQRMFKNDSISEPEIRVSHTIKGRTPDALYKPVAELTDKDRTLYYERMMFCIEVPSIFEDINGNRLNLTIGGVRAYNLEKLYSRKNMERFKIFIGFRNKVCCNLCLSTDGLCGDIRVSNANELLTKVIELIVSYNAKSHLDLMKSFSGHVLSESQFAQFVGKGRLYQNLPVSRKRSLPEILLTDSQINLVAKSYYQDKNFRVSDTGGLPLWNLYNLFTGATKSSYIDCFLGRSLGATYLTEGIGKALSGEDEYRWFIE